jgi:hypothetical protein
MRTSSIFGLVAAAAGIVLWLIAGLAGLQYLISEEQMYLTLPFVFLFSILAVRMRKRDETAEFGYIECLKTSLALGATAGLLLGIFNFAYYTLVAPGVVEALARHAAETVPGARKLDLQQREALIVKAKWIATVDSSIAFTIGVFLYSLIFGAIIGIFMRTKRHRSTEIADI